jgi:hypothetical protein
MKNVATKGKNTPMQRNLNIIHPGVISVFSLLNLFFPLPLTFILRSLNSNSYGCLYDRLKLGFNFFAKGSFGCHCAILGAIKVPPTI